MQDAALDELKALIEAMFLVASVDGEFSIAERRHFMDMVTSLSDGRLGSSDLLTLIDESRALLARDGRAGRLAAIKAHLSDETACRLAYGLATQVALVDGLVDTEKQLLDEMATAFGLSEEEHEEIEASVRFTSYRPPEE